MDKKVVYDKTWSFFSLHSYPSRFPKNEPKNTRRSTHSTWSTAAVWSVRASRVCRQLTTDFRVPCEPWLHKWSKRAQTIKTLRPKDSWRDSEDGPTCPWLPLGAKSLLQHWTVKQMSSRRELNTHLILSGFFCDVYYYNDQNSFIGLIGQTLVAVLPFEVDSVNKRGHEDVWLFVTLAII